MNHDFTLPWTQRVKTSPEVGQSILFLAPNPIAREAKLNAVEEVLIPEGFCEELDRAALHRLHRHGDVAVPGDEDDGKFPVRCGKFALKIKTALLRQSHVEDQARGPIRRIRLEKIGDGREKLSFQSDRSQ